MRKRAFDVSDLVFQQGLTAALGGRSVDEITDSIVAADLRLEDEHPDQLDAALVQPLGYARELLRDVYPQLAG